MPPPQVVDRDRSASERDCPVRVGTDAWPFRRTV